jgi:hypothetical protein
MATGRKGYPLKIPPTATIKEREKHPVRMWAMKTEKRYFQYAVRAGSDRSISGKIPYNSLSRDLGGFRERLQRGCFADTIKSGEKVMAFWNHDTGTPLGSTSAGTLRLDDRSDGLHFTIVPPSNSWGEDVLISVKRGDIDGCSFGFRCRRDSWESGKNSDERIRSAFGGTA